MIIIGILFSIFYFFLDSTKRKIFALPCSIFIIFYSLSFDLIDNEQLGEVIFRYKKFFYSFRSIFFYFATTFGILIGILLTKHTKIIVSSFQCSYKIDRIKRVYYLFSILSSIGFIINISHIINNIQLLFIDPRAYQNTFGEDSIINYLYFLNVPALCIGVLCNCKHIKLPYSKIINFFLIVISFFHGIKFTIFDAFMYPIIFYSLLENRTVFKKMILVALLLIIIFLLFAEFIRGGSGKSPLVAFLGYILPNYYNVGWVIENHISNFGDIGGLISPGGFFSPTSEIAHLEYVEDKFIFSPSYNMFTALHVMYNAFNIIAPLILFPIIFQIQLWFYKKRKVCLSYLWISTYLELSLFFAFYFYAYMKPKFIYFCIVFFLVDKYCTNRKSDLKKANDNIFYL